MSMNEIHCFTYGSLMSLDIMRAVAGRDFARQYARLDGYSRHPVSGEDYPGIIPCAGASVEGYVYLGIDATALTRLDLFEGPDYVRSDVQLTLQDHSLLNACAYVYQPALSHRLATGDWDFARFEREGKQRFKTRFVGFGPLPDQTTA